MNDEEYYDGFFFLPGKVKDQFVLHFFELKNKSTHTQDYSCTKYHIALFTINKDRKVSYDNFEANLGDAVGYATNLVKNNIFGCIVRKTQESKLWWDNYLSDTNKIYASIFGNKYEIATNMIGDSTKHEP
jgi:hypothetical protein